ncbi:MAG TPA: methylated-DNA--[protein]-cysteine S-methyltransferase [Firmicutes bacterium]|nr:methylated-DNA--[protein]-cysteine S-methyltransferase [Bacillota bacterium]
MNYHPEESRYSRRGRVLYSSFDTDIGQFLVASTWRGVVHLLLPTEPRDHFFSWLYKLFGAENVLAQPPGSSGSGPSAHNDLAADEIRKYLTLELKAFSVPLDLRGSEFQLAVWERVRQIPHGSTASYSEIARAIGRPKAVRAVGAANRANPIPIIIPCHRVIGSNGSLVGYGGGLELKRYLLDLERAVH